MIENSHKCSMQKYSIKAYAKTETATKHGTALANKVLGSSRLICVTRLRSIVSSGLVHLFICR